MKPTHPSVSIATSGPSCRTRASGTDLRDRLARGRQPAPSPGQGEARHFLYQAGGPSHLETFDWKPKLAQMSGKGMPESLTKGQQIALLQNQKLICFGPQHPFKKFGQSGQDMCELLPHIGSVAARNARRHARNLGRRVRPIPDVAGRRPRSPYKRLFIPAGRWRGQGRISYGSTDELGCAAEEDPVSVRDFHATMLYLLGIDHRRLAVKFQGLDLRLTGISGDVVRDILA